MAKRPKQKKGVARAVRRKLHRTVLMQVALFGRTLAGRPPREADLEERIEAAEELATLGEAGLIPLLACGPYESPRLRKAVSAALSSLMLEPWVCCPRCGSPVGPGSEYVCEAGPDCGEGLICVHCGQEASFAAPDGDGRACPHYVGFTHEQHDWFPVEGDHAELLRRLESVRIPKDRQPDRARLAQALGDVADLVPELIEGEVSVEQAVGWCRDLLAGRGHVQAGNPLAQGLFTHIKHRFAGASYEWSPADSSPLTGAGWFYFLPSAEETAAAHAAGREAILALCTRLARLAAPESSER